MSNWTTKNSSVYKNQNPLVVGFEAFGGSLYKTSNRKKFTLKIF